MNHTSKNVRYMFNGVEIRTVRWLWRPAEERKKGMFYLTTYSIFTVKWRQTYTKDPPRLREKTAVASTRATLFRLAARVLLYTPSHIEDSTYHGLCYTSRGALTAQRNSAMCLPRDVDRTAHHTTTPSHHHGVTSRSALIQTLHCSPCSVRSGVVIHVHRLTCQGMVLKGGTTVGLRMSVRYSSPFSVLMKYIPLLLLILHHLEG